MSLLDVAFTLGPWGAIAMAPLAIVVLVIRRPRRAVRLGAPLMALVVLSWVGFWYLWGKAFDYADANTPVPTQVDTASNVLAVICALSCVAPVATALTTFRLVRRADIQQ